LSAATACRLLLVYGVVAAGSGGAYFLRRHREGRTGHWIDGMDPLMQRGQTVALIRQAVRTAHPPLPRGAILVFQGVDVAAMIRDRAPRVWLGDATVQVFAAEEVEVTPDGVFVGRKLGRAGMAVPPARGGGVGRRLDPARIRYFVLEDGVLVERPLPGTSAGEERVGDA